MSDRAWILLPSGKQLDLLAPDPWAWTDDDLAIGLSRTYRWAGYSPGICRFPWRSTRWRCWPCVGASPPSVPCLSQRQGASCCTTRPRR